MRSGTIGADRAKRVDARGRERRGAGAVDLGAHRASIAHRSTISGSRAALSMTVVPSASTAAIRMFSVAPTLGKSSQICAPESRRASATRKPCSMSNSAPSRSSPESACRAGGSRWRRRPAGRPGPAAAREQRAEHADRGAHPSHELVGGLVPIGSRARRWRRRRVPPCAGGRPRRPGRAAPRHDRHVEDVGHVRERGGPSASRAAAISLSTLFFAPGPTPRRQPCAPGRPGSTPPSATVESRLSPRS